jgi:hypothetical protein
MVDAACCLQNKRTTGKKPFEFKRLLIVLEPYSTRVHNDFRVTEQDDNKSKEKKKWWHDAQAVFETIPKLIFIIFRDEVIRLSTKQSGS